MKQRKRQLLFVLVMECQQPTAKLLLIRFRLAYGLVRAGVDLENQFEQGRGCLIDVEVDLVIYLLCR